jgi:hypothetical protein
MKKRGRPRLSDDERAKRQKISKAKYAEKKRGANKGKGGSWLARVTGKLDAALSETEGTEESTPSPSAPTASFVASSETSIPESKAGDPFADLPTLEDPGASQTTAEDADPTKPGDASNEAASADGVGGASKASEPKIEFDNDELVAIAETMVTDAMNLSAKYCADRGFFAIGGPFAKIVGKAAGVIVKSQATKLEIDSEEGAAWILAIAGGTNGVQTFRAYRAEQKASEERAANERRAASNQQRAVQAVNGVNPSPAVQQAEREAEQRRAAEQRSGPVV